tara:strand:+ start:1656 stop:1997 length:342 start_codon:yes stop_codon:yes gene_type:complete
MKHLIKKFNAYLNETSTHPDFRFEATLTSHSKKERGKNDILNDIRSLPGVTIVAVREADKPKPGRDYSLLSLKVDRWILGNYSVKTIIGELVKGITKIEGVIAFNVKGIPEKL